MLNTTTYITYAKYATVKNVIYQRYSILEKTDENRLNEIFSSFGKLENVARNTYLFPYDVELCEDMKSIGQSELLISGLQEKYRLSDKMLLEKFKEYHVFEFDRLLRCTDLLDESALEKFHYPSDGKKII